jgi:hypothetical protein
MNKHIDDKLPLNDLASARQADAEKFDKISKDAWDNKDFGTADLARQQAASAREDAKNYEDRGKK